MSTRVTAQRRKEAPELGDSIVSLLYGLVARAAEGDLEAIEQLRRLEQLTPQLLGEGVAAARCYSGYSWAQLAPSLGMARTSASERFRDVKLSRRVVWTACGRATFTAAGRFLHERKCLDCGKRQELGA